MTKTALVVGASGGIGGEVARVLVARRWTVRALHRDPAKAPRIDGVTWVAGDAMNEGSVVAAATGAEVIVHAVNPPGYRDWDKLVLPMMRSSIAAARASGARILLPATLYNFGSGTAQPLREDAAQQPSSRKGAIRVQMEALLRESGVRSLVVRAGDFFGPRAGNNWFAQGLIKPGAPLKVVSYPGDAGEGHSWAYLPDLADTMVRLLEQEARLERFAVFHFRGHYDGDGTRMIAALRAASGRSDLPVKATPWLLLRLMSPFVTVLREMMEMRYLWRESFELDNAKLLAFLDSETHTPWEAAVGASLQGLGCMPEAELLSA